METIALADWRTRFWAWLIDVLLISILWYMLMTLFETGAFSLRGLGFHALLMFLYWTVLEGSRGQSMGKMAMGIAVVGPAGERIGFVDAGIESFGKAFLLPLDCIVGALAFRDRGQRLFNRLSGTVVAEAEEGLWCSLKR
jgi:uncharacterized RDD family membrane protein YckC